MKKNSFTSSSPEKALAYGKNIPARENVNEKRNVFTSSSLSQISISCKPNYILEL